MRVVKAMAGGWSGYVGGIVRVRCQRPPMRIVSAVFSWFGLLSFFFPGQARELQVGGEWREYIPSYGVSFMPLRTASQRNRSVSFMGPRCRRASLGDLA